MSGPFLETTVRPLFLVLALLVISVAHVASAQAYVRYTPTPGSAAARRAAAPHPRSLVSQDPALMLQVRKGRATIAGGMLLLGGSAFVGLLTAIASSAGGGSGGGAGMGFGVVTLAGAAGSLTLICSGGSRIHRAQRDARHRYAPTLSLRAPFGGPVPVGLELDLRF